MAISELSAAESPATSTDPEYIKKIASYVDLKMREIASGTPTVDSLKIAVLAERIADSGAAEETLPPPREETLRPPREEALHPRRDFHDTWQSLLAAQETLGASS